MGTYQNKWLLDITYICILVQISYIYINAFSKNSFYENKYKLVKFMKLRESITDKQIANENPKGFKKNFLFFILSIFIFCKY